MGIPPRLPLDLQDRTILDWLVSKPQLVGGEQFSISAQEEIEQSGMKRRAERISPNSNDINIITWMQLTVGVYIRRGGRDAPYATHQFVIPVSNTVRVTPTFVLATTGAEDANTLGSLLNAFQDYQYPADGLIADYIAAKEPVLPVDSRVYALFFDWSLELVRQVPDEKWLDDWKRAYKTWRIPGWNGDDPVVFKILSRVPLATHETDQSDHIVEVPLGQDEVATEAAIAQKAVELARLTECRANNPIVVKLGRMDILPDTRTVWRWEEYNWGCVKFHFYKPILQRRDKELVLYATCTYNTAEERLKKVFTDSLQEAGESAAIIALAFQDLNAGITAFTEIFKRLVRQKLNEWFECLIPSLYTAEEFQNDWHEA